MVFTCQCRLHIITDHLYKSFALEDLLQPEILSISVCILKVNCMNSNLLIFNASFHILP